MMKLGPRARVRTRTRSNTFLRDDVFDFDIFFHPHYYGIYHSLHHNLRHFNYAMILTCKLSTLKSSIVITTAPSPS